MEDKHDIVDRRFTSHLSPAKVAMLDDSQVRQGRVLEKNAGVIIPVIVCPKDLPFQLKLFIYTVRHSYIM